MGIKVYNINDLQLYSCRAGSDGYQAKYYADNKKNFIKTQARLSGLLMEDWKVEIIASKICKELNIYSVEQKHCKVKNNNIVLDAVVSKNFENDFMEFISFESLVNRFEQKYTNESWFIKLSSYDKLVYCAYQLSKISKINNRYTMKYMLDLAIIDILLGNTDRHTKNFGLFWDTKNLKYCIARIFDNGMGLFENDYYRDTYNNIEERLRNVYIAPYGEDPFDMIKILKSKFNLNLIYNFNNINSKNFDFPNYDSKLYFNDVLKQLKDRS